MNHIRILKAGFLRKTTLNNWNELYNNINFKNQTIVLIDVSSLTNKDSLARYNALKLKLVKEFPILWLTSKKLTWSVSSKAYNNPVIVVNRVAFKDSDQFVDIHLNHQFQKGLITKILLGILMGEETNQLLFPLIMTI